MARKFFEDVSTAPWPLFVRPKPDELFSSWLLRNAWSHRIKVFSFYKTLFDKKHLLSRDIDRSIDEAIIQTLSIRTATTFESINNSLLSSFIPNVFLQDSVNGLNPWILPVKFSGRKRVGTWLQCCPSCLRNDSIPYYRKTWRLAFVFGCAKCKKVLIDKCPKCDSPINFLRIDIGNKGYDKFSGICQCYNCKYDLRKADQASLGLEELKMQRTFDNLTQTGFNQSINYSHLFFEGLYSLICIIKSQRTSFKNLRKFNENKFNLELSTDNRSKYFCLLSNSDRRSLLTIANWYLLKWPKRFIEVCEKLSITQSRLLMDHPDAPFWFSWPIKAGLSIDRP